MSGSKGLNVKKEESRTFGLFGQYAMLPVIFVVAIIPLISRLVIFRDLNLEKWAAWFPFGKQDDYYLLCKVYALYVAAVAMIIFLLVKLQESDMAEKLKSSLKWLSPILAYGALGFISTVVSKYRGFGLNLQGSYGQHESVWVVLTYVLIAVYTYLVMTDEHSIQILKVSISFLILVESVIGLTQITGHDFFFTDLGKKILIPDAYAPMRDSLKSTFEGDIFHSVFLTLYNPNYVGMYAALLFPVCAVFILSSKGIPKKIWWSVMFLGVFVSAIGSGSKTFLLSIPFTFFVGLLFYRKLLKKGWPLLVILLVLAVAAGGVYFKKLGVNPVTLLKNALTAKTETFALSSLEFTNDGVKMTYNGKEFTITLSSENGVGGMQAFDADGNRLTVNVPEESYYTIDDPALSGLKFYPAEATDGNGDTVSFMYMEYPGVGAVKFKKTDDGYTYITDALRPDKLYSAPSVIWTNNPRAISGRGFIWGRTIPLLPKYLVLGSGCDTFSVAFPNNDYFGLINSGYGTEAITKPHNIFLQLAVNEGVLALICFLIFVIGYIVSCFKTYWRADISGDVAPFGIAVCLAMIGYLFLGATVDSCVAVAPVFWVLIGAGYAVNRIYKESSGKAAAVEEVEVVHGDSKEAVKEGGKVKENAKVKVKVSVPADKNEKDSDVKVRGSDADSDSNEALKAASNDHNIKVSVPGIDLDKIKKEKEDIKNNEGNAASKIKIAGNVSGSGFDSSEAFNSDEDESSKGSDDTEHDTHKDYIEQLAEEAIKNQKQ